MNDWKTALENVLAQAPSAALAMGQTEIFRSDAMETIEASLDQCKFICLYFFYLNDIVMFLLK